MVVKIPTGDKDVTLSSLFLSLLNGKKDVLIPYMQILAELPDDDILRGCHQLIGGKPDS